MMRAEFTWMLRHNIKSLRRNITLWYKYIGYWRLFWKSYWDYKRLAPPNMQPSLDTIYPCLNDHTEVTSVEPIYFYQDSWAFELIYQRNPRSHIDVGSHHKFVAFLSKVVPVTMVDTRPLSLHLESLNLCQGSILNLPFKRGSISSLSSLCVLEHIGLGRYGDPIDPYGTENAIYELKRVLAPGADLYISIPIDNQDRVYVNAHRSFKEENLFEKFNGLQLLDKRYIFGNSFTKQPKSGFGIGCYHLQRM
jgi:hypothetical protein